MAIALRLFASYHMMQMVLGQSVCFVTSLSRVIRHACICTQADIPKQLRTSTHKSYQLAVYYLSQM